MRKMKVVTVILPVCLWSLAPVSFGDVGAVIPPVQGMQLSEAVALPATNATDTLSRNTIRIDAQAVGSNRLTDTFGKTIDVAMELNNTRTRVGAQASMCDNSSAGLWPDNSCDEYQFLFPDLRIDESKRLILQGNTPVARMTHIAGIQPVKGYRLKYEIVKKPIDTGFDQRTAEYINVYLQRTAGTGN